MESPPHVATSADEELRVFLEELEQETGSGRGRGVSSGGPLEASQMPEIERLEAFIRELEDELTHTQVATELNTSLSVVAEEDEDDDDDAFLSTAPSPRPELNLDSLLRVIQLSSSPGRGQSVLLSPDASPSLHTAPSRPPPICAEPVHPITSENFFSSAQDDHIHTPKPSPLPLPTPPFSATPGSRPVSASHASKNRVRSFRVMEDFTMESLKRNWEMEEELDDNIAVISNAVLAKNIEDQEMLMQKLTPKSAEASFLPTAVTVSQLTLEPAPIIAEVSASAEEASGDVVTAVTTESPPQTPTPTPPQTPPRPAASPAPSTPSKAKVDFDDIFKAYNPVRRRSSVDQIEEKVKSPPPKATAAMRDERLKGDFMICSAGEKLGNGYIFNEYVGLHPTQLTHCNDNGKLVPSPIPRRQYKSTDMSQRSALGKLTSLDPAAYLASVASSSGSSGGSSKGFYNVHVMECIIRPDVELKSVMAAVVQIARLFQCKCQLLQRSHAVLTPMHGHSASGPAKMTQLLSRLSVDADAGPAPGEQYRLDNKEFDSVDVQICISRSVRQRVVLLQFMRKMLPFNGLGFGNILLNHLSGPLEALSLKQCPDTKRFMSKLRKEIIAQEMSFSSLYQCSLVQVCALPQGLDAHFIAQLNSLCRDTMWMKLDEEYKMMEEHSTIQDQLTADFVKAMEPMYKHYGLPLPPMPRGGTSALVPYSDDGLPVQAVEKRPEDDAGAGIAAIMAMASPSRKMSISRTTNDLSVSALSGGKVDGMAFCLILLDRTYQDLQLHCDEEFGQRVQRKNLATITSIQERAMYKRLLLTNLFNHPDTRSSAFQQAFVQLFQHVPVATARSRPYDMASLQPQPSAPGAAVKAPAKSWFGGWSMGQSNAQCFQAPQTTDDSLSPAKVQAATAALSTGLFATLLAPTSATPAAPAVPVPAPAAASSSSSSAPPSRPRGAARRIDSDSDLVLVEHCGSVEALAAANPPFVLPDRLPRSTLFYYCACLVGVVDSSVSGPRPTMALSDMLSGTCYVSAHYVCLVTSSSLLAGMMNNSIQLLNNNVSNAVSSMTHKSKEVYRFQDLRDVAWIPPVADAVAGAGAGAGGDVGQVGGMGSGAAGRLFTDNGMVKLSFFGGLRDVYISPLMQEAAKVKTIIDEVHDEFTMANRTAPPSVPETS